MVISQSAEPWVVATLMLGLSWITWIGWIGSLFQKKSEDDFTTPLRRMLIPVFFTIFAFDGYMLSDDSLLHYLVTGTGIIAASIVIGALTVTIYKGAGSKLRTRDKI
jgi:hypothetical protein